MSINVDFNFVDWLTKEASIQEQKLWYKMCDFMDCFSDMTFCPDSITYKLIEVFEGDDSEASSSCLLPSELGIDFTYNWFKTEVKEIEGGSGRIASYDETTQTICVSPDHVEDDAVLLHEMIHLHEHVIDNFPLHYHDLVYWALYQDLRAKIEGLDDAINDHAHLLNETQLYLNGGVHDILFLLKSFDLDMRMGYPFGTVFGYERVDRFKYLKVIK